MSSPSDYDCPRCGTKLRAEAAEGVEGVDLLVCIKCWGLAVQAKSMEGVVPGGVLESIEKQGLKHVEGRSCPVCPSKMVQISVPNQVVGFREAVKIDVCGDCATIWFDVGELDALNGIKPKLRKVEMEDSADKITAVVDHSSLSVRSRRAAGAFLVLLGLMWMVAAAGACGFWISLLVIIGGAILALTVAPKTGLEKGACSRCGIPNQTMGWTCQRAGCEAPICTTCRSVGDDPAETYVKTLGGGALMVAGGVLGLGLLIATEGLVGEFALAPAALGYELLFNDEEEKNLLVCKECKKEMGALQFATDPFPTQTEIKNNSEKEKTASAKEKKAKEFLKSQTRCLHVDGKTVKRCRRLVYRKSGYCYKHLRE